MNNKIAALVLGVLIILTYFHKTKKIEHQHPNFQPNISQKENYSYSDALNSISLNDLKSNLNYLSSDELEGRMSGKKGNIVAAEFVKNKFESYGLPVKYQKFPIKRLNPGPNNETGDDFTQNIIAWIDGGEFKDEIVVIGGHMDHIGYGPAMSRTPNRREIHNGADDNASGTVALLEVAKAFSKLKGKLKRTVLFQAYSAEEMGLIGSRYYCENPMYPIKNHVFMLNMDMVGYLNNGQYASFWNSAGSSPDVTSAIDKLNTKYNFAKSITSRGTGGSDHASFYNKGIPVAFLHTGLHPYYHTPDDDANKINFNGLEQISRYAFELAYSIVEGEEKPVFNYDSFKAMSYTHDHGHMHFHNH